MNNQPGMDHKAIPGNADGKPNIEDAELPGDEQVAKITESTQHNDGNFTGTIVERIDAPKLHAGSSDSHDSLLAEKAAREKKIFPQIPNYKILDELGRGGMGVVFLARQQGLNRRVAIKMILNHDLATEETRTRFNTEAEVIARLEHPGIVKVYEFNSFQETPYFALEYLSGGSLDKRIKGKPFPGREAAFLVRQLADALQAAHDQSILHRDLKPANVLLSATNEPKITDFGLAKHQNSGMTGAGQLIGTPSYMAPEQARGEVDKITTLSDIYSLGAILYELCTGRPPFRGESTAATIQQVIEREVVPVRKLNPGIDRDLETICLKTLSKDPRKRYATAKSLFEDLGRYLNNEPILARPISSLERLWKWSTKRPALAASLLASLLLVIAFIATIVGYNFQLLEKRELAENQAAKARSSAREAQDQRKKAEDEREEKEIALEKIRTLFALAGISTSQSNYSESALWFANAAANSNKPSNLSNNQQRFSTFHSLSIRPVRAKALRERVHHFSYHPNGRDVLICTPTTCLHWNLETDELADLSLPDDRATYCCYSPSGKFQAVGYKSGTVLLTEFSSGRTVSSIKVTSAVNCLVFHRGDDLLAIGSSSLRIWSMAKSSFATEPSSQNSQVLAARFNDAGTMIAASFANQKACIYSLSNKEASVLLDTVPHEQCWNRLDHLAPSFVAKDKIVVCYAKNTMTWWDVEKQTIVKNLRMANAATGYHLSPDQQMLSINNNATTLLINSENGKVMKELTANDYQSTDSAFSHDGCQVFVASSQNELHILSNPEMTPCFHPLVHSGKIELVQLSSDDRFILTADRNGIMRLWIRPKPMDLFHQPTWPGIHEHHLFSLNDPGTHYVAEGRDVPEGDCKVYSSQTAEPASPTLHIGQTPLNAAWSSDNAKVVIYSAKFVNNRVVDESLVHIYSWRDGKRLLPPVSIPFLPLDVVFTPDDKHFVVLGQHGQLEIRSSENGKRVAQSLHPREYGAMQTFFPIRKIRFLPSSESFITFGPGRAACLWQDIHHVEKPLRIFPTI